MDWMNLKNELVLLTGVSKDAWHVLAGLALMSVAALFAQRRLASPWPFLFVCAVAASNEYYDAKRAEPWDVLAQAHRANMFSDVLLTTFAPLVLFVLARYAPQWIVGPNPEPAAEEPPFAADGKSLY